MISRRSFLRNVLLGGGGVITAQCLSRDGFNFHSNAQSLSANHSIPLPPRKDVRLVVLSDLNGVYGSVTYDPEVHQAIAFIREWQPDLVICGGDMVAGQSSKLSTTQIKAMWQGFDQTITQPLHSAQIPFGFTLGNHDGSGYQSPAGAYVFERDRQLAQAYWQQVHRACGLEFVEDRHFPFYYAFRQHNIFYLIWDATTARLSPTQLQWVDQTLAQSQDAALRIVIGHLPLYAVAVGRNKPGEILSDAATLHALLVRHNVHTYISGHHHAYYPAQKDALNFLHSGALGGGPRSLIGSQAEPFKSLTVVDINLDRQETHYSTLNMASLTLVDHQVLPSSITGINGTLFRQN